VGALSAESRRVILEAVRSKLGWSGALAALGISRAALSRYLSGERASNPASARIASISLA